ncbi:MAG TPA: PssE/Cps14G family polysaccharide biosynthesis glycosyltransferase [Clostridia bacterium]|nr:PssE/Cps14G family polysaccharide biosynthesis glycosyltransferase [Clostridia bacterium]
MILVLLGTQNNSFLRLLEEVDRNIVNGVIEEEVIVQAGYTKYESNNMKIHNLVSSQEMEKLIEDANFIISHGGVGSILQCVKKGKTVIAIPRQKKYKEHVNDHQLQLVKTFADKGYIIGINDIKDLQQAIISIKKFKPKEFTSNTQNIINKINFFINENSK